MARAKGKSINVKVPVAKLIKALEDKLVGLNAQKAEYDLANEAQTLRQAEYKIKLQKFALSHFDKATNLRVSESNWRGTINVDFDIPSNLPDAPVEPKEVETSSTFDAYNYKDTVNEISNAIRILRMTDEETVSTSTYNTVAQYL